jgi:DNA-binding transcriptional regulator LsrR (DeoR family)
VTQDELARMTGATRQTVNRVLRRAMADGHIALGRGTITVLDVDALAGAAS